jgi:hypothetical protein
VVSASSVDSFAVYYGTVNDSTAEELSKFDLVILSSLIDSSSVEKIKVNGAIAVGYVSLTTVGGWEPWADNVTDDMVLDYYGTWGEKVVNWSDARWRDIVLNEAIPYVLSKGFDGVFLDNLDMVDVYGMDDELIDLIKAIREKYPDIVIVVNRGFSIAEGYSSYVDYVLFENFVTYYDFGTGEYRVWEGDDLNWTLAKAQELKDLGLDVLALSYANMSNLAQVLKFAEINSYYASMFGFPAYMTEIYLQSVGVDPYEVAVDSFAVYYGEVDEATAQELSKFDLVVLSPTLDSASVEKVKSNGTIAVGYVSLTTVGGWEPWADNVTDDMIIGEMWGEKVVNWSDARWRDIVLNEIIPYVLSNGYDGILIDNLDMVDVYGMDEELIDLIKAIRETYPDIVIVANRGFSIAEGYSSYVNYVLFDSYVTYYDYGTGEYKVWSGGDLDWILAKAQELKDLGLKVLALGYVDLNNETQVLEFAEVNSYYASMFGFPAYMTDIDLQSVGVNPYEVAS